MPDFSATSITVGGRISTIDDFDKFMDALTEGGAGIDWQYCSDFNAVHEHLLQATATGCLVFSDGERAWGDWGEVVAACEALKLHYCIEDDGCVGAWAPHRVYYHPDTGSVEMAGGSEDGEPMIALSSLVKWRDSGELLERLAEVERLAVLPPFEIAAEVLELTGDEPPEQGFGSLGPEHPLAPTLVRRVPKTGDPRR